MPPLDFFKKVHELPKEGDADYQIRMEFLLFCLDLWLPKAAGFMNFKPSIRHHRKMVDRMELPSGKKVAHVSTESEGFSWVVLENCHEKWTVIAPKQLEDPDWERPACDKRDETTWKCHTTKWSDGRSGQVKGGGWAPEACDALTVVLTRIHAIRKHDKSNGWPIHKEMLRLLREHKGITDAEPSENARTRTSWRGFTQPLWNSVMWIARMTRRRSVLEQG